MSGNSQFLSALIFLPVVASLFVFLTPKDLLRPLALLVSLAVFGVSLLVWNDFDAGMSAMQFVESHLWIPALGVRYELGVDGISLPLVMLTTLIFPIGILGTWSKETLPWKERLFVALILLLEGAILGSFLATDLILFYIFWEAVLIPMYFLIGVFGGQQRIYATVKFFIYTLFGSLLMLVAIFYLVHYHHQQTGEWSALWSQLMKTSPTFEGLFSPQALCFWAFALAFAIKIPMFPFHTWLPDAHVQAPTIGSVYLAAVLLKMGSYGFMRFSLPFFPEASRYYAPIFLVLGVIGIVYGAMVALVQTDVKKLVAYSSVSHMGFILLGLFSFNSIAQAGALYQMINHGIATGGLFLIVGFLYERRHTRELSDFGGLAKIMPKLAVTFLIIVMSSAALPGTNGFVGEFPILLGTFQVAPWVAFAGGLGVIFGAVYLLKTYQAVMLGPVHLSENKILKDLNARELLTMVLLIVFVFAIGFFPQTFFSRSKATLDAFARMTHVD